jgi:DNA-binding response OmpR family regulator
MKKRILIVENDKHIRELLSIILEEEGYHAKALSTEEAIFDHIKEFQPDTILLDVMMHTAEGTELCRTIKAAESTKHIPVIALSTHIKIDSLKEICADEIVRKPFDIPKLLSVIEGELTA